jgi:hypothetical protein
MDYVIGNLHNIKTNRYHPIVFRTNPIPSDPENEMGRTKSIGHHTTGFDTRDLAIEECNNIANKTNGQLCIEKDFIWDGEDIPVMVTFFKEIDNKLILIM